jgi:uncharacterized membrane protein YbjE (DUF340 family)
MLPFNSLQIECGGASWYCPSGTAAPLAVGAGWYSLGGTGLNTRTGKPFN